MKCAKVLFTCGLPEIDLDSFYDVIIDEGKCTDGEKINLGGVDELVRLEDLMEENCMDSDVIPPPYEDLPEGTCPNNRAISNFATLVCVGNNEFLCEEKTNLEVSFPAVCPAPVESPTPGPGLRELGVRHLAPIEGPGLRGSK